MKYQKRGIRMDHNDFYAAFGLGRDDKHINTTDADV